MVKTILKILAGVLLAIGLYEFGKYPGEKSMFEMNTMKKKGSR